MQTLWYDTDGRIKAVYDGDTSSSVWSERGYSKAVSDPKKVGRLSQDHVVTVQDGKVSGATLNPLPPTPEQLIERINRRATEEREKPISFESGGETHYLPLSTMSQTLSVGAALKADRSKRAAQAWKRKLPTDKGFPEVDADQMLALFDKMEARVASVIDRQAELVQSVKDGTFVESDLDTGWPD